MLASELRSVLTGRLGPEKLLETDDAMSPWSSKESRRILVFVPPMRKEAGEFTGRNREAIEIKSREKATMRQHVFFQPGPGISPTFACLQRRDHLRRSRDPKRSALTSRKAIRTRWLQ